MNHDYAKFMVYDIWIITVNRKLNSLNSVQETNLKHDMTVINLCDMLRNFYEIYVITQIMRIMWFIWIVKTSFQKVVFEPLSLIDFENI